MLKPKYIEQLPDAMIQGYSQVEQDILADMARRIASYDYWIPAADWQYRKLIEMGNFHSYVWKALSARTGKTEEELAQLMAQAGAETLSFDRSIYQAHGLSPPPLAASGALQGILREGLKKTKGLFQNLTGTTAGTATQQFETALDRAWLQISSGAFDANAAIRMAVKDLARQGVGAIAYPTGHVDSLEVAVRRAVVTGVNQTALGLQGALAQEMGWDLVETTAHAGARPSHGVWQGRVFSLSGKSQKYPEFAASTGYGTGEGLGGWNCRHSFFPYVEGSPRAYTAERLQEFEAKKYEYKGRKMTEYEASQTQRYHERQIRRWKRENLAMEAAGQDTAESAAKLKQWQDTQKQFLAQTGLKRQRDRETVANPTKSAILCKKESGNGDVAVRIIGKIDVETYRCVAPHIITDEVVLTAERIEHIKQRHPNDYERFYGFLPQIVADPDYIIADTRPNTAMVLKKIESANEHFRLALRLSTPDDNPDYKNSVLTFLKIREKEWNRLVKNKTVLYKRE